MLVLCLVAMAKLFAEDKREHVLRPDDPVAAAGAFATQIGALGSEEARHLDREEELDVLERDLQQGAEHNPR